MLVLLPAGGDFFRASLHKPGTMDLHDSEKINTSHT